MKFKVFSINTITGETTADKTLFITSNFEQITIAIAQLTELSANDKTSLVWLWSIA